MWVVLTYNHGHTGGKYISWGTQSRKRKDAIANFIEGSGNSWRYWKEKYNFCCERVLITIETIEK